MSVYHVIQVAFVLRQTIKVLWCGRKGFGYQEYTVQVFVQTLLFRVLFSTLFRDVEVGKTIKSLPKK